MDNTNLALGFGFKPLEVFHIEVSQGIEEEGVLDRYVENRVEEDGQVRGSLTLRDEQVHLVHSTTLWKIQIISN